MPDFEQNLLDAINSLRIEIARYRREYYDDPSFKQKCYDHIFQLIWKSMAAGSEKFYRLTTDLIPLMQRVIGTLQNIEKIVDVVDNLKGKPRFYMMCFSYLIVYEGNFKSILTSLLAMKRLAEGKKVNINKYLKVIADEKREKSIDEAAPAPLKDGIHRHLRNSVAHAYFTDVEEDKMRFWDVYEKRDEYSMEPRTLDYKQFSRYFAEVQIFCDIYGLIVLLFLAFDDIRLRSSR